MRDKPVTAKIAAPAEISGSPAFSYYEQKENSIELLLAIPGGKSYRFSLQNFSLGNFSFEPIRYFFLPKKDRLYLVYLDRVIIFNSAGEKINEALLMNNDENYSGRRVLSHYIFLSQLEHGFFNDNSFYLAGTENTDGYYSTRRVLVLVKLYLDGNIVYRNAYPFLGRISLICGIYTELNDSLFLHFYGIRNNRDTRHLYLHETMYHLHLKKNGKIIPDEGIFSALGNTALWKYKSKL